MRDMEILLAMISVLTSDLLEATDKFQAADFGLLASFRFLQELLTTTNPNLISEEFSSKFFQPRTPRTLQRCEKYQDGFFQPTISELS